ncbi:shikimate dehydrogenase [Oceanobacillus chungangensis]|uniref:Shikimate dehydrogenase (NADP(+)) n=1 Tax=Oceanobacillus chungangensis TaxID=1229152 RepID=A0A3D8Q3F4_9BACI|nr:shikimate dehydrogenase [Oceanobacillus chungangensis]RDW21735.1 shikimate dehydrogenase [Oceanobacillus chungangensis]
MGDKYRFELIGFPIKHSNSPWIHESFFNRSKLQGTYIKNEIPLEDDFAEKIMQMKARDIDGFNITVPYKQTIIPYLDEVDAVAAKIGAVNTVLNRNGIWKGYNTDGSGYLRSLESKFSTFGEDKSIRILILGAGGAARGIFCAFTEEGFTHIDIANRTMARAEEIAKLATDKTTTKILTLEEAEQSINQYDLIIQTTSVGMKPATDQSIISLEHLNTSCIVSDIVYQPLKTNLLTQAEAAGAQIHYGHTMLLYQAQLAFEIWTGELVSTENMDKELQLILEGR